MVSKILVMKMSGAVDRRFSHTNIDLNCNDPTLGDCEITMLTL